MGTNMKMKLLIEISVFFFATCVLTENQDYGQYPESFFKHEEPAPFVRTLTENQDDGKNLGNTDNYEERSLTEIQGQLKDEKDSAVDSENRRGQKRRRTSQSKRRSSPQSKRRRSSQSKRRPSSQSKRRPSYQSKGRPSSQSKARPSYEPSTQPKGRPSY